VKKVPIRIINRLTPVLLVSAVLAGCSGFASGKEEAAYFVPPTIAVTPTPVPVVTAVPTRQAAPAATSESDCSNLLAYVNDLTIPDGSMFSPGETIDKRWLVENQGTCNWNSRYSLRLTGGEPMDVPVEQSLVPALAGSQAVIRIGFTAPSEPGKYRSAWQAYTPDARPFGDPVFIEIEVIARVVPSPVP
jgi:hypothetical protein